MRRLAVGSNYPEEDIQDERAETFRDSIFAHFSNVEDKRDITKSTKHELLNVLFMTLCAILCGANNLKEVSAYAKRRKKWLNSILDLPNGVPCYNTFWWLFFFLDPQQLNSGFVSWMESMTEITKGRLVAIDGKALRGTANKSKPNSFVHMVSMWAADTGLTLGQVKVDEKSNEITAIPKLLDLIDIKDAVVTIDAMGTQTAIVKRIKESKANYVLALKGNQSNLNDEVRNFFDQAESVDFDGIEHTAYHTVEEGHGRLERRHIYSTEDIDWLPLKEKEKWLGLKSISLVISERTIGEDTSIEKRLYISSLPADARNIAYAIRSHWGIEACHWTLDVAFREDDQKAQAGNIAENMSMLRRIALNLLKQDKKTDGGIELKRKQAGWDEDYLLETIGIKSF
jgi:predicted transposase YbfD/YdcC